MFTYYMNSIKKKPLCTLEELVNEQAPVYLRDIKLYGSDSEGARLSEGFMTWMEDHPETACKYHITGFGDYFGKLLVFVDMTEDEAERYSRMVEYEESRDFLWDKEALEIPELKALHDYFEELRDSDKLFDVPPARWETLWYTHNIYI